MNEEDIFKNVIEMYSKERTLKSIYKGSNVYLDRKFNKYLEFICRAM